MKQKIFLSKPNDNQGKTIKIEAAFKDRVQSKKNKNYIVPVRSRL